MSHSEKPLPDAITHNDEIARLILVELRGMRDDMAAGRVVEPAAVAAALGVPLELREPAPAVQPSVEAPSAPKAAGKKRGA